MKVTVIPVVIGTLGKGARKVGNRGRIETIQTTALLRWTGILRRDLEN